MNDIPATPSEEPAASAPPYHRLSEFVAFSPSELKRILMLAEKPLRLGRASVIREQAVASSCLYLLLDGWVASAIDFDDGSRQIVKIHLPGDIMGVPSMSTATTTESLTALTTTVVSRVPLRQFGQLLAESPRFAIAMFLSSQRERVALMDVLTRLGRMSAAQRLASLLLDLRERLVAAGRTGGTTFDFPLTQEQLADVLGITPVHVNRVLRSLERTAFIVRHRHQIEIVDFQGLARYARWSRRPPNADLDWVPAAVLR